MPLSSARGMLATTCGLAALFKLSEANNMKLFRIILNILTALAVAFVLFSAQTIGTSGEGFNDVIALLLVVFASMLVSAAITWNRLS
jgi:uncharacterized membrane protein YdbT with pleckstrin-like domain